MNKQGLNFTLFYANHEANGITGSHLALNLSLFYLSSKYSYSFINVGEVLKKNSSFYI